jgi:glucuronoarabinoxylan endo-1,4-beta-xylanase
MHARSISLVVVIGLALAACSRSKPKSAASKDAGTDSAVADSGNNIGSTDSGSSSITPPNLSPGDASASSSGSEAGAGADGAASSPGCGGGAAQSSDVTIDVSSLKQRITGFGVSSAWAWDYNKASDADYLWSTTKGAGLTLLRIRYGDGLGIAKSAVSYGVTVWMTPWGTASNGDQGGPVTTIQTNPNGCDPNNNNPKGTPYNIPVLTNPTGLANDLVTWVQSAKNQGVPIYAVSAENEPDSCGINATTSYSPAQMATWIETLGPAMAHIGVKVMAPETMNWWGFPAYFTAIQNDKVAYGYVNIFASHQYGRGPDSSDSDVVAVNKAIAADSSKEYWQTEVDPGSPNGDTNPADMPTALITAQMMHNDLTKANLNAWHIWWLYGNLCTSKDAAGMCVWAKRLWAMGNFSRFVRPGYKRVDTSGTPPSDALISAYINPVDNALAIVAINNSTSSTSVSFYISGKAPCSLTPYETSADKSLGQLTNVAVSNSRVTVTLAAQSVTTFVGK